MDPIVKHHTTPNFSINCCLKSRRKIIEQIKQEKAEEAKHTYYARRTSSAPPALLASGWLMVKTYICWLVVLLTDNPYENARLSLEVHRGPQRFCLSYLLDLLSCGSICQAPHHHTLCYNLLSSLLTRLFIHLLN